MNKPHLKLQGLALATLALAACLAAPLSAHAADQQRPMGAMGTPGAMGTTVMGGTSDRAMMPAWTNQQVLLREALPAGHDKAFYTQALADQGYRITSVNKDEADEVEYEVVKAAHTYEVQIDFDKAGGMASGVDVDANLWRADSTKAALAGQNMPVAMRYMAGNERYSDGSMRAGRSAERVRLERSLAMGHDKAYYPAALKKMGYQVTAVNDNEKDYLEMEVVRGRNSYEVQIDFDGARADKVDVAYNMWEAEGTEKALDRAKSAARR